MTRHPRRGAAGRPRRWAGNPCRLNRLDGAGALERPGRPTGNPFSAWHFQATPSGGGPPRTRRHRWSSCGEKSLTIKFTPEEWEIIARIAGREPIATWAREVLLALVPAPTPFEVVTAEILALRTLVLHVQLTPFGGEPVTAESLRRRWRASSGRSSPCHAT